jgi:hypothetical protein
MATKDHLPSDKSNQHSSRRPLQPTTPDKTQTPLVTEQIDWQRGQISPGAIRPSTFLALQRKIGNRATQRMMAASDNLIQRTIIETGYGKFEDVRNNPINQGGKDIGVDMVLKFEPGDNVDAKKIGLTQAIKPTLDGKVDPIDELTKTRIVEPGKEGEGYHHDRISERNNPIYGAPSLGDGETLKDTPASNAPLNTAPVTGTNATFELGYRYTDGGLKKKDAKLWDAPKRPTRDKNAGQIFETTALALEGAQAGDFYGSVQWGWTADETGKFTKLDLTLVSQATPSQNFIAAAKKWNSSQFIKGTAIKTDGVEVFKPNLTLDFNLDKDTTVEVRGQAAAGGVQYSQIKVTAGAHLNKIGFVKASDLQHQYGDTVDLPVDSLLPVTFEVRYSTRPGQDIFVSGNTPELGNWDPKKAAPLKFVNENTWRGQVMLNPSKANKRIEYKYIMKEGDKIRWEEGGNHRPPALPDVGKATTFSDAWDDGR